MFVFAITLPHTGHSLLFPLNTLGASSSSSSSRHFRRWFFRSASCLKVFPHSQTKHERLLPPVANSAPSWRSKQLETFYLIFSQYPILSSCQLFSDEKVFIGILTCDLILQCREPQRQGRGWFVFQRAHSINNYVGHSDGPFDTLASVFPKKCSDCNMQMRFLLN